MKQSYNINLTEEEFSLLTDAVGQKRDLLLEVEDEMDDEEKKELNNYEALYAKLVEQWR